MEPTIEIAAEFYIIYSSTIDTDLFVLVSEACISRIDLIAVRIKSIKRCLMKIEFKKQTYQTNAINTAVDYCGDQSNLNGIAHCHLIGDDKRQARES